MSEHWDLRVTKLFVPGAWECQLSTATWESKWEFLWGIDPSPGVRVPAEPTATAIANVGIASAAVKHGEQLLSLLWFMRLAGPLRVDLVGLSQDLCVACQDCRGSGQYVGFAVVEPCEPCGGRGVKPPLYLASAPVIQF